MNLKLDAPVVMAILNITPDSFFAGSRRGGASEQELARAVEAMVEDGASIIDVGGYSSRPGADEVSPDEEFARLKRGVEVVRRHAPQLAVSIDTFRAEVARRIINEFGECIVNDISAGELDAAMISTVRGLGVPYIAMHMRGTPADMQQHTDYEDIVDDVLAYFASKMSKFEGIGQLILDPGFGFAKSTEQNYSLLKNLHELATFGYPILSGVSRKSMIYKPLGITPADSLPATTALNWESLHQGAKILRVHDVAEAVQVIKIFEQYDKGN